MTTWIDEKYISQIAYKLPLFKKKSTGLYNFRCPLCGDSKKNKFKCRGFLYQKKGQYFYRCHNCGEGTTFGKFLEQFDASIANEYTTERFLEKGGKPKRAVEKVKQLPISDIDSELQIRMQQRLIDQLLDRLDTLPESNIAVQEALRRHIPRDKWCNLYYIDNIKKLEQLSDKYRDKIVDEEPRIVIPFFDRNHRLFGMTCRDLLGFSNLKYVTVMLNDHPQIWGLDQYDPTQPGYIVEGPLDAQFLPNALAAGGTALKVIKRFPYITNYTVVFDNQPRNKEVCALIRAACVRGDRVCIWPDSMQEKDINDLVLAGKDPKSIIDNNTFQGPEALLRFTSWKKIAA